MTFGERVRARRNELKISAEELALLAGYGHVQTLYALERDERHISRKRLKMLSEALEIPFWAIQNWLPENAPMRIVNARQITNPYLRSVMERAGMTLTEVSDRVGLCPASLSKLSTSPEGWPAPVATRLAAVLGCDLAELGPVRAYKRRQPAVFKKTGRCSPETVAKIRDLFRRDPVFTWERFRMLMWGHGPRLAGAQ